MSNLFDNPTINEIKKNLSDEDKKKYAKFGESMYNSIDYNSGVTLDKNSYDMTLVIKYILEGLKSGLSVDDLSENEVAILVQAFGENWQENFEFSK
jgi:hypothetical protein